jgi:hypothetical protein
MIGVLYQPILSLQGLLIKQPATKYSLPDAETQWKTEFSRFCPFNLQGACDDQLRNISTIQKSRCEQKISKFLTFPNGWLVVGRQTTLCILKHDKDSDYINTTHSSALTFVICDHATNQRTDDCAPRNFRTVSWKRP